MEDGGWSPKGRATCFGAQLARENRRDRARQAAWALHEARPEFSARAGLTHNQRTTLIVCPAVLIGCGLLSPGGTLIGICGLVGLVFLALIGLRLTAALLPPRWAPRTPLAAEELPMITLLAPLRDEAVMLERLSDALSRLDYPADRLELLFIIKADDADTLAAAVALPRNPGRRIIIVPPGEPRTKPRALNYAMAFAHGELIAVYDAEDRPAPDQLRVAAESFAAGPDTLACLQAPLNWYNREDNWLTRQFALEYASQFHALLPLYDRLSWPLPLGGTSNIFRRSALRAVHGWDAWNVTEDADLGYRLAALGYHSGLISPPTLEEAPTRLRPWIRQRSRWLKGFLQTIGVHARGAPPAGRSGRFFLSLGLALGGAVMSAFLHAPLALAGLSALFAGAPGAAAAFFLSGYLAAATCAAAGMVRAGLRPRLIDLAAMPFYWPWQSWAAARALRELIARPYVWDKTRHGISPPPEEASAGPADAECA